MRSGLLTFIGLKVIHVDFYVIGFLSVVEAPLVNRRFTGSPQRGPWVGNFFEGLYMYIYTDDATQLNPLPPCSNVHYCTSAHYCSSVHYCTVVHYCSGVHLVPGCQVAGCVKGFFLLLGSDAFNRDIFARLLFALSFAKAYLYHLIWW